MSVVVQPGPECLDGWLGGSVVRWFVGHCTLAQLDNGGDSPGDGGGKPSQPAFPKCTSIALIKEKQKRTGI